MMRLTPRERVGVVTRRMLSDPHVHEIREIAAKVGECDGTLLAAMSTFDVGQAAVIAERFCARCGRNCGGPGSSRGKFLKACPATPPATLIIARTAFSAMPRAIMRAPLRARSAIAA